VKKHLVIDESQIVKNNIWFVNGSNMDTCPVCSHEIKRKDIKGVLDGIIYCFCCEKCRENLLAEPRRYNNCCNNSKENEDQRRLPFIIQRIEISQIKFVL